MRLQKRQENRPRRDKKYSTVAENHRQSKKITVRSFILLKKSRLEKGVSGQFPVFCWCNSIMQKKWIQSKQNNSWLKLLWKFMKTCFTKLKRMLYSDLQLLEHVSFYVYPNNQNDIDICNAVLTSQDCPPYVKVYGQHYTKIRHLQRNEKAKYLWHLKKDWNWWCEE